MKNLFLLFILSLIGTNVLAQGNIQYGLIVTDPEKKPLGNIAIQAIETSNYTTVYAKTDGNGQAMLELNNGKEWNITVGEVKNAISVSAVPFQIIQAQENYIYDVKINTRKAQQDPDRTYDGYNEIEQSNDETTTFGDNECMAIITLKQLFTDLLFTHTVRLVDTETKTIYKSYTDNTGKAVFIVPNNSNYDIDINTYKNFHFIDFKDESVKRSLNLEYAPTIVSEEFKSDTVYQKNDDSNMPSMERALMKIQVSGADDIGNNQPIYFRNIRTGRVYTLTSDENGMVYAQLPIQEVYLVDFEFAKNADAIDLTNAKSLTEGERTFYYQPDPRLQYPEKFIPTPDKLYLKSFNEFLTTQWEKPKDKPFLVKLFAGNKINEKSQEALFKLTLAGTDNEAMIGRVPLNIVLVLDKSGSMFYENRVGLLKKALWDIGNVLTDDDIVTIVLFDFEANIVLISTSNHLEGFERIIANYAPGGGTNILKGLELGSEEGLMNFDENRTNLLLLMTDGYGITEPEKVTEFVEGQYQNGLQFSTIGLGQDFNQALLELIAEKGLGKFSYADNPEAFPEVFLQEVKDAFSLLAKDVKIEITYDDHLEFIQLMGFPVSKSAPGKVVFEISKVPVGMNDLAFIKFKIKKPITDVQNHPINLNVSYTNIATSEKVTYSEEVFLEWTEETDTELLLDQHEQMLYTMAIMNQSLKVMADKHAEGDNKEAKKAIKNGIDQVNSIFPDAKPKEVKALFEDLEKYYLQFELIEKKK